MLGVIFIMEGDFYINFTIVADVEFYDWYLCVVYLNLVL